MQVRWFASEKKDDSMRLCIDYRELTLHDGGRYHIETSPLICSANQWTGFYMITASVMKGLNRQMKKPIKRIKLS